MHPQVPSAFLRPFYWDWSSCSRHLVLPFGGAWLDTYTSGLPHIAGLVFQDTQQSMSRVVTLNVGSEDEFAYGRGWADLRFSPDHSLVLVQSGGRDDVYAAVQVYDCTGELLHSTEYVWQMHEPLWSPSAQAVAFHQSIDAGFGLAPCLWALSSGAQEPPQCQNAAGLFFIWATPCSGAALALTGASLGLVDVQNPSLGSALPLPELVRVPNKRKQMGLGMSSCAAAWGARLVLPHSSSELGIYSLQEGVLVLEHIVTAAAGRQFAEQCLRLTGDGELGATVTGTFSADFVRGCHLAVIHLTSGTLREYPLLSEFVIHRHADEELRVHWSPDCSAVLASSEDGSLSEALSFA